MRFTREWGAKLVFDLLQKSRVICKISYFSSREDLAAAEGTVGYRLAAHAGMR